MKKLHLLAASTLAPVFGRPAGFCTANAAADPSLDDRISAIEAENAALKAQLAQPPPPPDSALVMLCKGAGVDISDVLWRIRAGLDSDQAVQAAISQRDSDAAAAAASKKKK